MYTIYVGVPAFISSNNFILKWFISSRWSLIILKTKLMLVNLIYSS